LSLSSWAAVVAAKVTTIKTLRPAHSFQTRKRLVWTLAGTTGDNLAQTNIRLLKWLKWPFQTQRSLDLSLGSAIALDYEAGATYSKSANTAAVKTFMDAVKKAGYKPILYSGAYYLKQYVDYESIGKQYGDVLWVASYKTTSLQTKPDFGYFPSMNHVGMWQYADNWYGIDGNVELINGLVSTGKVAKKTPVTPANAATNKAQGVQPIPKSNKYTIKQGDSWYAIAKRYGLDAGLLAQLNGKTTKSMIHPGNVIKLTGTITIKVEPKKAVKKPKVTTHVVKVNSLGAGKETWKVNLIGSNGKYANHYVAQGFKLEDYQEQDL
jgi:hypothetical protein